MLFIYWGWDTAVSVNEETKDKATHPRPGRRHLHDHPAGRLRARGPLVAVLRRARDEGIGLGNPAHRATCCRCSAASVFGTSGFGSFLTHLLLLMVLSSAAASTQTTILPTARTTLSMAVYKAIPSAFARIHRRFLTPTVSTLAMGGVSIGFYVAMNYASARLGDRRLGDRPRGDDRLLLRAHRARPASGTTARP